MSKYLRPFRCEILTPEGHRERLEALSVVFPASDGMVGVLGGRAPLVTTVGAGGLTVEPTGHAKPVSYFVAGGFARMCDDVLTVLTEDCCLVKDLDGEQAWRDIEQARALPADTDAQIVRRDKLLHAAQMKFNLIQQRDGGPKSIDEIGEE